ncbi:hypothetical protein OIU77_020062 [Salix suchowensis]|uniref:Uncharacterized protein n=1 Tax=Salix suchowensis TaxID=1278906 RepID=A0ABQ9CLU8_9ROSI|nr:hypothetical protein OIU77_020062 [Salix suchowensis]
MHSLTFFFTNFGTNATTFAVTDDIFPARSRSACDRISAASGKLGGILLVHLVSYIWLRIPTKPRPMLDTIPDIVVHNLLIVLGVLNLLTLPFIFLVPESMGNL